jgi:hypothetical protein
VPFGTHSRPKDGVAIAVQKDGVALLAYGSPMVWPPAGMHLWFTIERIFPVPFGKN